MSTKKHRISSSNLCLRFYLKDGWTIEELQECLISGSIEKSAYFEEDDYIFRYYVYSLGSTVDVPKLLSKMESLSRAFDDYPEETDEEFIRKML